MAQQSRPAERVQKTPEERAAARATRESNKLQRDRVRMLDGVQTMLRHAAAALATGAIERHDEYLTAAEDGLKSYRRFVALSAGTAPSNPE